MSQRKVFNSSEDEDGDESKEADNEDPSSREEDESEELLAEDSSDEEPEEVGFAQSRQRALQIVQDAMSQVRHTHDSLKEKRKARDEQYKRQKERKLKLDALSKQCLPADVLEEISAMPPIKKTKTEIDILDNNKEDQYDDPDGEDPTMESHSEEEDNYIPLEKDTEIKVVSLREELDKQRTSIEQAMQFRKSQLYGSRVPRESVQKSRAKRIRKHARFAAVARH